MSDTFNNKLSAYVNGLDAQGLRRRLRTVGQTRNGHTQFKGRDIINFSSNNYSGARPNILC